MDKLTIYTDGACEPNPGEGGWSCIIIGNGKEIRKSGYVENSTNQRMEVTAILEALKLLGNPYEIDLYTDSIYSVNTASSWLDSWLAKGITNKANMDLWTQYKELSNKHIIHFHHIKGHSGDTYNELCDYLAVDAIKNKSGKYLKKV